MIGMTPETRGESGDPGSEPSRERWHRLLPCFRKGTERVGSAGKALDAMNGLKFTSPKDRAGAFRPQVSRKIVMIPIHIPQKRQIRRVAFMVLHSFLSLGIRYKEKIDLSSKER